jgi:hypothetical protein
VRVFVVRAERCDAVTVQASNGTARIETLNFSPRTAPDHPISLSSLAGSSLTRHQQGGSPGRAARWDRMTTHELLQAGCDLAAKCDESLHGSAMAASSSTRSGFLATPRA